MLSSTIQRLHFSYVLHVLKDSDHNTDWFADADIVQTTLLLDLWSGTCSLFALEFVKFITTVLSLSYSISRFLHSATLFQSISFHSSFPVPIGKSDILHIMVIYQEQQMEPIV